MQTDRGLTALSSKEIDRLMSESISAGDAYRYISDGLAVRSFSETLSHYYDGDIKNALTDGLCRLDNNLSRESASRKVRDWLNNKYKPTERIDLIKICFALGFDETRANGFLSVTSDGGFHLRDPEELAYAYSLRVGKSYGDAVSLISGLKPLENDAGKSFAMTKIVADAFQSVSDDESFSRFYTEQYDNLGKLRNTAYSRFLFFLDLLIQPQAALYADQDEKYSVDGVVESYLRMNLPLDKNTSKMSLLQKTIRKYWPNATSVVKMRNRDDDVTRRILLLLYLVTEGAVTGDDEYDDEMSDCEQFEEHYWRLNSMLYDCGMSRLDPRNVFDWLVLYCLKTSGDEAMSERMQDVLSLVFETETS